MNVRAKFKVMAKTEHDGGCIAVRLAATNQKDGDNTDWSKWTPSGEVTMSITNRAAADALKVGEFYYVDFSPVGDGA